MLRDLSRKEWWKPPGPWCVSCSWRGASVRASAAVAAPGGDISALLVRKCNEEGVSYDIVRWIGCLQGMRHPCIAALQMGLSDFRRSTASYLTALIERCDVLHSRTKIIELLFRPTGRTRGTGLIFLHNLLLIA